jgi:hypothetical protein
MTEGAMLYYPAVLHVADGDGVVGCEVPDLLINASGRDVDEALMDAATILAELLDGMAAKGEAFPEPSRTKDVDLDGGTLVLLSAPRPRVAA